MKVEEAAEALAEASAEEIVAWAWARFGDGLVLTASFQDCVLIDVAVRVAPRIRVVFLDTQYHFPETWDYLLEVRDRYRLNLRIVSPGVPRDDRWKTDTDACCNVRKVLPLQRVLAGCSGWMTGVRRVETSARARTPSIAWDPRFHVVKINPLAAWSDERVAEYRAARGLPAHPLEARGYASVGCWPCTRPVSEGEDARAGRWPGTGKTECGLHVGTVS